MGIRQRFKSFNDDRRLILACFLLGIIYWVTESYLHIVFFEGSNFTEHLLTPTVHEAWMRLIVMVMFITFGFYSRRMLRAWKVAEHKAVIANLELSQIFETAADGMRIIDRDFNVIKANDTFATLVGLDKGDIIGHKCYDHFKGELCDTSRCPLRKILKHEQRLEYDVKKIRIDGSSIPCIVSASPFLATDGEILGIVEDFKDISERRVWEARLMESRERLEKLTSYLQVIREQERRRIAREIHDELGQSLSALNMDVYWLKKQLSESDSSISDKIDDMKTIVSHTARAVHRISSELRPGILDDFGLSAAIEWQAGEFSERTGIPCVVTSNPQDIVLNDDLSTAMFRIFQESLTNIVKHAEATRVTVLLRYSNKMFEMRIEDDGKGFVQLPHSRGPSYGMIGMQERVRDLGGKLEIFSAPNGGVTVSVSVLSDSGEICNSD
jgi:two-component system, NarL family, sensor histidine kinase UhpB